MTSYHPIGTCRMAPGGVVDDRLRVLEAYQEQLKETVPTPPNVTFTDQMTLFRGDREIRLAYTGRGHSDTDILVYLPKERVLMTGDFFEGPVTGAPARGRTRGAGWRARRRRPTGAPFCRTRRWPAPDRRR